MDYQDRVVTTLMLRDFATSADGAFAVPTRILEALDANALHVVAFSGPSRLPGKLMICRLLLDLGESVPHVVPAFVPHEIWACLPTCQQVLSAAARLIPTVTDEAIAVLVKAAEEQEYCFDPPLDGFDPQADFDGFDF